ncbi:MAG: efflux RND transporter periplasmic adaptor subunit [Pirellulaceae bacterium]
MPITGDRELHRATTATGQTPNCYAKAHDWVNQLVFACEAPTFQQFAQRTLLGELAGRMLFASWFVLVNQTETSPPSIRQLATIPEPERFYQADVLEWIRQMVKQSPSNAPQRLDCPFVQNLQLHLITLALDDQNVTFCVASASPSQRQFAEFATSIIPAYVRSWQDRQSQRAASSRAEATAAALALVGLIEQSAGYNSAAQTIADQLKDYFSALHIGVSQYRENNERPIRLYALSDSPSVQPNTPVAQAMLAAQEEAFAQDRLIVWPAPQNQLTADQAHQRLAETCQAAFACTVILKTCHGQIQGLLTVVGKGDRGKAVEVANELNALSLPAANALELVRRSEPNWWQRTWKSFGLARRSTRTLLAGVICFTIIGSLFVPVAYQVGGTCVVQPDEREVVTADMHGIVETVFKKPGDRVVRGELLIQFDPVQFETKLRSIEPQIRSLQIERKRHWKDRAKVSEIDARIESLQVERDEAKRNLARCELRATYDGIVLSSSVDGLTHPMVREGELLLTMANLESVRIEIEVPQDEHRFLEVGSTVKLRLNARPGEEIRAKIDHIHPVVETRNLRNVIVARTVVDNRQHQLIPQSTGRCKILTKHRRCVGWILFHQAWYRMQDWLGI